jgi:hypothetical protein
VPYKVRPAPTCVCPFGTLMSCSGDEGQASGPSGP